MSRRQMLQKPSGFLVSYNPSPLHYFIVNGKIGTRFRFKKGEQVTVEFKSNDDSYDCGNFIANGKSVHSPYTFTIEEDVSLMMVLAKKQWFICLSSVQNGCINVNSNYCDMTSGLITGYQSYPYGTEITVSLTPNEGYNFDYLKVNNGYVSNPYTFNTKNFTFTENTANNIYISGGVFPDFYVDSSYQAPTFFTVPNKVHVLLVVNDEYGLCIYVGVTAGKPYTWEFHHEWYDDPSGYSDNWELCYLKNAVTGNIIWSQGERGHIGDGEHYDEIPSFSIEGNRNINSMTPNYYDL